MQTEAAAMLGQLQLEELTERWRGQDQVLPLDTQFEVIMSVTLLICMLTSCYRFLAPKPAGCSAPQPDARTCDFAGGRVLV